MIGQVIQGTNSALNIGTYQPGDYADRILQTQITRLIEGAGWGNIVGFIMAVIWVGLLWNDLPHEVLSVWLGIMTLLSGLRWAVTHFRWYDPERKDFPVDIARRWYLMAVLITGAVWGIAPILMFPRGQLEQTVLAFILAGVAASGVTLSNVAWVYSGFVGLALIPLMVRLFYVGGEVYYALSAMTGLFMVVMIMAVYRMYRASSGALRLEYTNQELIENLMDAGTRLEKMNAELTEEIEYVKRMEGELKEARDRAEEMSRAKGEFLANMSHEIRTPMNGVIGTLQLLQDTELAEEQKEYVITAHKSADALLAILNDILDLSKIEAGKMSLENIRFDLRELISDLVALHAMSAEKKGVELVAQIDDALAGRLMSDPTRIRQIITNLVSNALKFTEQGSIYVRVQVLERTGDTQKIRVEVADTGVGIGAEVKDKLFNAFTQADGSTTRKYGGTGLGLTIVRQLVEMMQGEIGVDSVPGEGSTFWFELPLTVSTQKEEGRGDEEESAPDNLQGHVLLVEDNPVNKMIASKMLEKVGITSLHAEDGQQALDLLESEKVDAVLMDCQMPVLDGFEATRRLRERERETGANRLPIIAMTANVMSGDRERCLDAGMDDYIGKPIHADELRRTLGRWLQN